MTRDSVLTAARDLGYDEIEGRAEADTVYLHEMAKVVRASFYNIHPLSDLLALWQADDRISTLRRNLKINCTQQVQAFFELHTGCADRVTALLDAQNYIFPGDFMNVCCHLL